ncbi:hypothetical protein SLEP1_g2183 [Rubroshorea leprosula]|uniref:Uncharacterized protein n=1 Tax=Rubroshorea leprosula TaxID=152421 RepID=A0AAV5HS47_9ROSI|nr:hypothetical protein SLEP1_g2183 [Rubroshorea leprosula]
MIADCLALIGVTVIGTIVQFSLPISSQSLRLLAVPVVSLSPFLLLSLFMPESSVLSRG